MPRTSRPLLLAAALCVLLGVSACAAFVLVPRQTADAEVGALTRPRVNPAPEDAAPKVAAAPAGYGLLDGVPMTADELRRRTAVQPVAVMIDNWVDARPQVGLDRAEVVYEALVEYGITRFMAVYWRADADLIEPVRSARTQFLPLVLEWGAIYAHVGAAAEPGPADSVSQMRAWGVRDVDELEGETVIKRDPEREAPHNATTSTDALHRHAKDKGWTASSSPSPWPFKADGGAQGDSVTAIELDFDVTGMHKGAFTVRWEYDAPSNSYRRSQGGAPHVDGRSGAQLTAKNVIIHIATLHRDVDRDRHVLYDLEGTGQAVILQDGKATHATWHKDSRTSRTRYLDAAGREIPLNRGPIWVEVLPDGQPFSLS